MSLPKAKPRRKGDHPSVLYDRLKSHNPSNVTGVTFSEFRKITIILFNEIAYKLIQTGENMWMPRGELIVRLMEERRAFHIGYHGNERIQKIVPILSDFYPKVLWVNKHIKASADRRGVKVTLVKKFRKML